MAPESGDAYQWAASVAAQAEAYLRGTTPVRDPHLETIRAAYLAGMADGEHAGYARGRADALRELVQRTAGHVAQIVTEAPRRDTAANKASAQRRADWWAARRGEAA